ncbi:hypothetical protein PO124_07085 [Bacillus licheniformis]|nr:hypothetical protein [Bacillus licheniformis]
MLDVHLSDAVAGDSLVGGVLPKPAWTKDGNGFMSSDLTRVLQAFTTYQSKVLLIRSGWKRACERIQPASGRKWLCGIHSPARPAERTLPSPIG